MRPVFCMVFKVLTFFKFVKFTLIWCVSLSREFFTMITSDLLDLSAVVKVARKNNNSSQLSNSLIPQDHVMQKKIPNLSEEKVPTAP